MERAKLRRTPAPDRVRSSMKRPNNARAAHRIRLGSLRSASASIAAPPHCQGRSAAATKCLTRRQMPVNAMPAIRRTATAHARKPLQRSATPTILRAAIRPRTAARAVMNLRRTAVARLRAAAIALILAPAKPPPAPTSALRKTPNRAGAHPSPEHHRIAPRIRMTQVVPITMAAIIAPKTPLTPIVRAIAPRIPMILRASGRTIPLPIRVIARKTPTIQAAAARWGAMAAAVAMIVFLMEVIVLTRISEHL